MSPKPVKLKDWQRNIIESRPGPEFKPAGSASLDQVFAVYRNNRDGSRRRALQLSFGLLAKLLSPESFATLCQTYIDKQAYPSNNLNFYGRGLEQYLKSQLLSQHQPLDFFRLLIKFEWRLQELLLEPVNSPLSMNQLQAISQARQQSMPLCLLPNKVVLRSRWPLDALWLWHQQAQSSMHVMPIKYQQAGYNVAWLLQTDMVNQDSPPGAALTNRAISCQPTIAVHHVNGVEAELFEQLQQWPDFTLPDLWQLCETLKLEFPLTLQKLLKRQWLSIAATPNQANATTESGHD